MPDYIFSVRKIRKGAFLPEPGPAHFLEVPDDAKVHDLDHKISRASWFKKVQEDCTGRVNPITGEDVGDIVVYVHGFNNSLDAVVTRHRFIKKCFQDFGFEGTVVSFDWPSDDSALNYLEDRWDAKQTANQLVKEGIANFVRLQRPDCEINLHIMAHSMGTYVVREAFDDADDRRQLAAKSWAVSQVLLFGADISAGSLAADSSKSSSLYRHCARLTNYYNHFDNALKLSNVKRIGVSPRAGRIGLPDDAPDKAVNISCTERFDALPETFKKDDLAGHRFYFEDTEFMRDAFYTILGDTDRHNIPTRARLGDKLILKP
ncbi:alpha/beta hydrolase [Fluviibacterium sp. S390]|uniref:alpha/beta hydrolase n=1 Tax=Fluviibacterium sp. S390 TaxID=3415139 RepID=UPI003C7C1BD9